MDSNFRNIKWILVPWQLLSKRFLVFPHLITLERVLNIILELTADVTNVCITHHEYQFLKTKRQIIFASKEFYNNKLDSAFSFKTVFIKHSHTVPFELPATPQ